MITEEQQKAHQRLSHHLHACMVKYNHVEAYERTLNQLRRRLFLPLTFLSLMLLGLGAFVWPFWSQSYLWGGIFLGVLWIFMNTTLHRLGPVWNEALSDWYEDHVSTVNNYLARLDIAPFISEASSSARSLRNLSLTLVVVILLGASVWLSAWKVQQWGYQDLAYLIGVVCGCLMLVLCMTLAENTYRFQTFSQLLQPLYQAGYYQIQELLSIHNRLAGSFSMSDEERINATAYLKRLQRAHRMWLGVISLMAIPLAYLGSLALAQIAGLGYSYVGGLRMNGLLWAFFTLMILTAENSLKQGFTLRELRAYSVAQILLGWRLEQRGQFLGYRFCSWDELRSQKNQATAYFLLGLLLLSADAVANYWYFVYQTGTPWHAALLVALMLPAVVVFFALKLSKQQQQVDLVKQFLALNTERLSPILPGNALLK